MVSVFYRKKLIVSVLVNLCNTKIKSVDIIMHNVKCIEIDLELL